MCHFARYILPGLLTLPMNMTLLAQGTLLRGVVHDRSAGRPVPAVHVIPVGGRGGTTTDERGYFELKVKEGRSVRLAFHHISYIELDTLVRPQDGPVRVMLRPRVVELPAVDVERPGPEVVYRPPVRHVADHLPTREGIWVLAYDHPRFVTRPENVGNKPLRDVRLLLLDPDLGIRASIVLPGEVVRLHPSRDDGVFVEGIEVAFHVRSRNGQLQVDPFPLDSLFHAVLPWTDSIPGRLLGNDRVPDFPAFHHFAMDPYDGSREPICSVEDAHTMALFRSQYKYMSGHDKVVAMRLGQALGVDKQVVAGYMTGFPGDIYFHCPEAPLFVVHDTLCVFDRSIGTVRRFTLGLQDAGSAPLDACETKGWRVSYLQDPVSRNVYVHLSRNGRSIVRPVNISDGRPGAVTEVPQPFVSKVRIRDGAMYYLYRTPGTDEHTMLFRLKLR
ncbi:MAG: hypothetical protein H6594_12040 [Flavobacteriales bacterium]|nr:hypothetical protein [Flavobacteriales bacterium]